MEIDGGPHRVARPFARQVEMRDLAQRVHAGVGAAGAAQRNRLAGEFVDRLGEAALHGLAQRLHLPADEGRAVILEREAVAGHCEGSIPASTAAHIRAAARIASRSRPGIQACSSLRAGKSLPVIRAGRPWRSQAAPVSAAARSGRGRDRDGDGDGCAAEYCPTRRSRPARSCRRHVRRPRTR